MSLFSWFTAGLALGVSSALAPGPMQALVITQSLRFNFREGVKCSFAPLFTDVPLVTLSVLLLSRLSNISWLLGTISFVGAIYVAWLGLQNFRSADLNFEIQPEAPKSLSKAVLTNLLNPNPYLFWTTVGAPLVLQAADESRIAPALFLGGFYLFIILAFIILAFLAGQLRHHSGGAVHKWLLRGLGLVLFVFAVILFRNGLAQFGLI